MLRLVSYEFKKTFLRRSVLIALIVFSIIDFLKINSIYQQKSLFADKNAEGWSNVYRELYEEYKGEITLDKIDKLLQIYRPLEKQTANLTASTATDNPNTMTGNIYSDFYLLKWMFVEPMEYFFMYGTEAEAIAANASDNMDLFRDHFNAYEYRRNEVIRRLFEGRRIGEFAYTEMYNSYLYYDFSMLLMLLLCLYGTVNVFIREKETEMDRILLAAVRGGKRTVTAKLTAVLLFTAAVTGWFLLLDHISFGVTFGSFEGARLPVYAIQSFAGASVNLTLGGYILLSGLFKIAGMITFALFFLTISLLFSNALFPFIGSLIISFLLILAGEGCMGSGFVLPKVVNPVMLLINREIFGRTEFVNMLGTPVISYAAAIGAAIFLCLVFISLIYRVSGRNAAYDGEGGQHDDPLL